MNLERKTWAATAFACVALFAGASAASPEAAGGRAAGAAAKVQQEPTTKGLARAHAPRASTARSFQLQPPPADLPERLSAPSRNAPLQVGIGRDVADLETEAATGAGLQWETLADGSHVAAIRLTSPSASSVRAGLRVRSLPASAIVRFHSPAEQATYEVSGEEIADAVARNIESGDTGPDALLYWSPLIEGDSVVVEVQLPAGTPARAARVAIPRLSHLVTSAAKHFVLPVKAASACELDAMCSPAWAAQMNAVARMVFTSGGSTFLCSGTLLADQDAGSTIPYFLSANHCISTQTDASSLTTFWFYRSSACNATSVGPYEQLAGGAALLYASSDTDTSFMRLNNLPPAGAVYAGWFAGATPATGTGVTGLHHPRGDWLKISAGSVSGYLTCTPPTNGSFSCSMATASASTFYDVRWTSGITEPGSSGSGLFRDDGVLVGQLYGGSSSCTSPGGDVYGRFDIAYNNALGTWLAGKTLSVSKDGAGSGTVGSAPAGINCGSTCSAAFPAGTSVTLTPTAAPGSLFTGWSGACNGTGSCVVTMSSAMAATASFAPATATLSVSSLGAGTVTSSPAGISCGATCAATFPLGSVVTLVASPSSGMAFNGWSGACSGTGSCVVTVNAAASVTASFGAKATTTTTVASSANPSAAGQSVILTAAIAGGSDGATGTVSFFTDGAFVPGCSSIAVVGNAAACPTSSLTAGTHAIFASYSGDATHAPSASGTLSQMVDGTTTAAPGTLVNLSTRAQALTGDNVMIGGFVIGGSANKTVVVTAIGPSLAAVGIANPLANPTLTLVRSADGTVIATNDDWGTAANASQIRQAGFAPTNPLESAVMASLPPGAYTAIVSGAGGTTGVSIVAVYQVDHPEVPLVNLSTRAEVLTGNDVVIGGFVIQGSAPQTVVVTGTGPSLGSAGVANALPNPALTLVRSSDQAVLATNDDWGTAGNAALIQAKGFAPSSPRESAIMMTLDPGAYTVIMSGVGGVTGVGILAVYSAP